MKRENTVNPLLAALTGMLLGLICYYYFYGWYNIFPWAVAALAIGYISKTRRESLINGAIFGYILFLVYIYAGYKGKTETSAIIRFILFDLLFSLTGAIAGMIGAFIGNFFKRKFGGVKGE